MHSHHQVFLSGISQSRKLKLTFSSEEPRCERVCRCAPLYHSKARPDEDVQEYYYFWDFEAREGYNFTALPPSDIISIELTEDSFDMEEICGPGQEVGNSTRGPDLAGQG